MTDQVRPGSSLQIDRLTLDLGLFITVPRDLGAKDVDLIRRRLELEQDFHFRGPSDHLVSFSLEIGPLVRRARLLEDGFVRKASGLKRSNCCEYRKDRSRKREASQPWRPAMLAFGVLVGRIRRRVDSYLGNLCLFHAGV